MDGLHQRPWQRMNYLSQERRRHAHYPLSAFDASYATRVLLVKHDSFATYDIRCSYHQWTPCPPFYTYELCAQQCPRQSRSPFEREPPTSKLVSYTYSIPAPTDNILTSNAGPALCQAVTSMLFCTHPLLLSSKRAVTRPISHLCVG